jgi:hypothetical protein
VTTDVVRVLPPTDDEMREQWSRAGAEPELTSVEAVLLPEHPWQIVVAMAEFAREEPLDSRLSQAVIRAMRAVPGVSRVEREDTEVWLAWGTPAGDELLRAVAGAVDALVPQGRLARRGLGAGPAASAGRAGARATRAVAPGARAVAPADRKPVVACGVLATIGVLLLVSGLLSSDAGTAASGAFSTLFFGGGALALIVLDHR